jgi:transposase
LALPIKKTLHAKEQDRQDVLEQRKDWADWQKQIEIDKLVFIDESGAKTNMTRTHGRGICGQRVLDKTPAGTWQTITMISSIDSAGQTQCMVVEGATTKEVFLQYLQQVLAESIRPGDIVIMDNLSSHKGDEVREIIESKGATVKYLPPYSPDLNPIEMMWSKVKNYLKDAKARTKQALCEKIGEALTKVSCFDARGWFKHCGYAST